MIRREAARMLAAASLALAGRFVTTGTVPLAGVLRPGADGWVLLNDSGHKPINLARAEDMGDYLRIHYTGTFSKVGAVVISPDEQMAMLGYRAGVSAGKAYANAYMFNGMGALIRPADMPADPSRNWWVTGQMWL